MSKSTSKPLTEQIAELEQAIVAQDSLRPTLGDTIVDTTITALREKLAELEAQARLPEQRRKQVTILFADVSGFTAMSETLDAEEVGDTMNALWQRIDTVIIEHDGLIDKHIGDAVMALWGVDETREDDPERAIRAALAMQTEIRDFVETQRTSPLHLRVGINTGRVLLGSVGTTGEFSAIGDAVNLASRLEKAAPVGVVLISHDTYRQVRGIFDVLPQDPIRIKGKSDLVQTYIVQGAKHRAFRMATRGVQGIETHMVGRDAELLTLQNEFRNATLVGDFLGDTESAETCVVTVVGEAGVGKSRLLYEFENWIELQSGQIHHFKGRATPEMVNIYYGIIRDMLAFRFDILETDRPAIVQEKFRTGMSGILDADQADLVGHLVGFDFSTSQAVQNLLGSSSFGDLGMAYLTTYVRAVVNEPTMILLEDIHWADDRSLDLLAHLVDEVPAGRLLVVCLARPQLFERRPNWGWGEAYTQIDVKPLSRRVSRVLVGEILQKVDRVPNALRDLIVNGAEGNPFYVEEFVKMLVEDGVIVRGDDQWYIELDRLADIRVPPTLTSILQARLDSLPRAEKRILQRASVVGRLFWDEAVARLATGEESVNVIPLLNAVQGRELIFQHNRSAFEGTHEYMFKHALLRDVTYETVLLKLRRVYHAQVAQWLEANAKDRLSEYLSLISRHYELAGEKTEAVKYLRRLGEELLDVSAYRDAADTFERALVLLSESDVTSRAEIMVKLGYAYRQLSDYPLAIQQLEKGLALVQDLSGSDLQTKVAALNGLGWAIMGQGAYDKAMVPLKQALVLAREIDDREGAAIVLYNLGDVAYRQGESEQAEKYAQESLELCEQVGDRQGVAYALRVLGFANHLREKYQEATRYHRESQVIYREIGDRWGVATCSINLGESARMQKKYAKAAKYYEESLPVFDQVGNRVGIAIGTLNLGHVYTGMDQDDVAWRYLRESLKEAAIIGALSITLEGVIGVALLCAKAQQYERSAELLGLALAHPMFNQEISQFVEPILTILREALPTDDLEAVLERGKTLQLEQIVTEILTGTK
ncbi:MAG: tetratricopeptide repeat protein [Chloroflexi bacterium]|nr:tetratricopeptide repeat protein [Chloroflexota bacterium]